MLEKIQELLGEELAKQVTSKLGDVELAIYNDGSVVPSSKYDTLKGEHKDLEKKYSTEIADFTAKLEDASKNSKDFETLQLELTKVKTESANLQEKFAKDKESIRINSALKVELIKNNVKEAYIDMVMAQTNKENLKIDGESILGLKETVESAVKTYPDLFGEVKIVGTPPNKQGKSPDMSEKSKLIEMYNEAEKKGKFAEAFAIGKKIKALKE